MSKYKAIRTQIDGIWFDSKKEALRYSELKMLQRGGVIKALELQVEFPVFVCELKTHKQSKGFVYRADFVYQDDRGRTIVEDCKGMRTPVYRLKKRMVEAQYGIRIQES